MLLLLCSAQTPLCPLGDVHPEPPSSQQVSLKSKNLMDNNGGIVNDVEVQRKLRQLQYITSSRPSRLSPSVVVVVLFWSEENPKTQGKIPM